jgi:tetratricopeptide (TPR) repeat protein
MGETPSNRPAPAASGTLAKTPLIHLLLYAREKRLVGTVEFVLPDQRSASILFWNGEPAKARTSESVAYLGRVLLELGYLTEDQLTQSLADLAVAKSRGPMLHGQLLLGARRIDKGALQTALREQLARKLRHIAGMPDETKYFYYDRFDGLRAWGPDASEGFDPVPMLWGMLRESPPWTHVEAALSRVAASSLRLNQEANLARLGLTAQQRALVDRLRQQPILAGEVIAALGMGESDARLLVYLLLATKQVDVLRTAEPPVAAAEPVLPSMPRPISERPEYEAAQQLRRGATSVKMRVASTTPPAELSPELSERWREIIDRAANIDRADYFMMLEVARDATHEDVQSSFLTLAKKWHPDRLPSELAPLREPCSRVFARMSEAHATLIDDEKRAQYMRLLADGSGSPEMQETVAKVVEAATNFQKAEVCLRRNDLAQAEVLCRKAHEADATQSEYLAMLAWLVAQKPDSQSPGKTAECIQMLDRAISMNKRCERAYFWRGLLHRRLGKGDSAVRDFRRAAELNPRNIDAAREVRLHRMRGGRTSSRPPPPEPTPGPTIPRASAVPPKPAEGKAGLLGRFFNKK